MGDPRQPSKNRSEAKGGLSFHSSLISTASYKGMRVCENYRRIKTVSLAACVSISQLPTFLLIQSHLCFPQNFPRSIIPHLSTKMPFDFSPFMPDPATLFIPTHLSILPFSSLLASHSLIYYSYESRSVVLARQSK